MKRILVLGNSMFMTDFEVTVMTEEVDEIDFGFASTIDEALNMMDDGWNEFCIQASFLREIDLAPISIPVTCFARTEKDIDTAKEYGIDCYGRVQMSSELLRNIIVNDRITFQKPMKEMPLTEEPGGMEEPEESSEIMDEEIYDTAFQDEEDWTTDNTNEEQLYGDSDAAPEPVRNRREQTRYSTETISSQIPVRKPIRRQETDSRTVTPNRLQQLRAQLQADTDNGKQEPQIDEYRKPAEIIVVYSAKGGVGKTTISCNLATFLALTESGRDHYKVVICDFNIDYGNVMSTLGFNAEGICMTTWANDIKERLQDGEDPDDIQYSEVQIHSFLQKDHESGLYALLAPLTNLDSMDIREEEIRIMLRNLKENGGFDFIVCDTGNNTRDSSIIPIEEADHVLIVLTQSVNTVNDCYGFIDTVYKLGFDTSRMAVVINRIRPDKKVGVSVSELESFLVDPGTGKPLPCLGKLVDDDDVARAANDMVPLVYKADHDYTKAIGQLASKLIGVNYVLEVPKKKGFFARIFSRM